MRIGWSGWSFEVPDIWTVTDHPECITLELSDDGALQASSAYKSNGDVTPQDLLEFADGHPEWGPSNEIRCGEFSGIVFHYADAEGAWSRWFLSKGGVLLFVTYTGTMDAMEREALAIRQVVSSLRAEQLQ
jgi:hypothetical protein